MAFTRDWDESTVADTAQASTLGQVDRNNQVDLSDRLKDMIYGFIAGENSLSQHFQYVQFYEQASVSQPSAGYGRLYCKAVGGKCELHWQDEDGDEIPLTAGGNIGGPNLELLAGKDLIGSSTSDITINTNKFTVAGATGNTAVAGTLGVTGVATLGDTSALATSGAPAADAQIANKKYVDDSTKHYDSGSWAACSAATTATITHNLGTQLVHVTVLFSTAADGTNSVVLTFNNNSSGCQGVQVQQMAANSVVVQFGNDKPGYTLNSSGVVTWVTSGYYRVLVSKVA